MKFNTSKELVYLLFAVALLAPIMTISGANYSVAQKLALKSPITDFVNSEPDNNATLIGRKVSVFYESPQTVILRYQPTSWDLVGHVIDFAKQKGFSIDSITIFARQSNGTTWYTPDIYTIFMSRK